MKGGSAVLLWTVLCVPVSAHAGTVEYGIRFVVDATQEHEIGERERTSERLATIIEELNGYYRNSKIVLRAVVTDLSFVDLDAEEAKDILGLMEREQAPFAGLFANAERAGADYTVVITRRLKLDGKRGCGRAYAVNRTVAEIAAPSRRLAVVNPDCGAHTLAHELGHLMGLNHGVHVDACRSGRGHATALTPHALGYAVGNCDGKPQEGEFGSIMVGGWMGVVTGQWSRGSLPMYSNPRVRSPLCGSDQICGDPATGDAARVLNEHAHLYANRWKRREAAD